MSKLARSALLEGVEFDKENETFAFDFNSDSERSIVKLVADGPYQIEDYDLCTYFGYVFEDDINSQVKKQFIDLVKYPGS